MWFKGATPLDINKAIPSRGVFPSTEVTKDSESALRVIAKMASPDPVVNKLAAEVALVCEQYTLDAIEGGRSVSAGRRVHGTCTSTTSSKRRSSAHRRHLSGHWFLG